MSVGSPINFLLVFTHANSGTVGYGVGTSHKMAVFICSEEADKRSLSCCCFLGNGMGVHNSQAALWQLYEATA